jgi:hypothetical protein
MAVDINFEADGPDLYHDGVTEDSHKRLKPEQLVTWPIFILGSAPQHKYYHYIIY